MRGVIIAAGPISDYEYAKSLIKEGDFIVCADGGLSHGEKMGVAPNLIVGDFDSYKGKRPEGENVIFLPCEKDYTDTYTAAMAAVENGAEELIFLGAEGGRADHTFANIALLSKLDSMGIRGVMADKKNTLFIAQRFERIFGNPGDKLSLVPLGTVKGVTLKGFKYPLTEADIFFENPVWVSNELSEPVGEITFESGALLVIRSED